MDSLIIPGAKEADPVTGAFHACGHHTHIASMLGAAIGLCKANAAKELSGSVAFIGCPAEECIELDYRMDLIKSKKIGALGGKPAMIRAGVFDDIDIAAMIHISSGFNAMDATAFVKKRVRFTGKAGHAAVPHSGINALNAANLALHALALVRETCSHDPRCRIHGILTKGGDSINVIPDDVRLDYQLRASSPESLRRISEKFDRAMKGSAMAVGAKVKIETVPGYHAMHNDRELYDLYLQEAKEVCGIDPDRERFISPEPGSTDMGDVSAIMPAIHPFAPGAAGCGHGADFHVPDLKKSCADMAKIMAFLAIDLLYGDAVLGKKFAEKKKNCMSIPEYIKEIDAMK